MWEDAFDSGVDCKNIETTGRTRIVGILTITELYLRVYYVGITGER